jgi:hypothetical protein
MKTIEDNRQKEENRQEELERLKRKLAFREEVRKKE